MPSLNSNKILSIETVNSKAKTQSLFLEFDRESRNYLEAVYQSIENGDDDVKNLNMIDLGHEDLPYENNKMKHTLAGFFLERRNKK